MQEKKPYKRKIIVVKKSFQFKYATIVTVLFALACFTVWWEIHQSVKQLTMQGIINDPVVVQMMASLSNVMLLKATVALVLVWILALALSHWVAGPVYRVEKGLEALGTGDFTHRIFLRKRDQFASLAEVFNRTAEALQEKARKEQSKEFRY